MLKILINAYACSPNMGSEPGMAWNWCVHLAKHCELHIITEGEFRQTIESVVPTLPQAKNMHFYYNTVSDEIRTMCWNQGDWRFYKHYRAWQYKTYEMALSIMQTTEIDIVHQLNMIGFREPGYLWKINSKPFIWGPIGGMFFFPIKFINETSIRKKVFILIKNIINVYQIKYSLRVSQAIKKAHFLISSTPNEVKLIRKFHNKESFLISETGCYVNSEQNNNVSSNSHFNILWVGRFIFSKQLSIALKSIALNRDLPNLKFHIVGTGSKDEVDFYTKQCNDLNLQDIVVWHNQIPNNKVLKLMQISNVFFFTSVAEATSTVVLEALSCNLPVLCFDTCGFGAVIDEKVGVKIPLSNPQQSVKHFAEKIEYLYNNRQVLKQMSENCTVRQHELSWDSKAKQMLALYEKAMKEVRSK